MTKYRRYSNKSESLNVFPAFTDLMSNAFMILSLFLFLALFQATELNRKLQSASPIMIDEKSGNFKFPSGSAELTPPLKKYIDKRVIPAIEKVIKEKEGVIDFIQVIGHTDGQENNQASNLDQKLEIVAAGKAPVKSLNPGSNADLGLMRALSVIQEIQKTGRFKKINFKAYSAGQLYDSSGKLASVNRNPDKNRRRIEIRFIPPGRKQ
ncbi:MAG: flagellar motor protein [Merismopediaceae bacterium]|nr:flagellar motor protein [Merismopediaceae bacterium]